MFFILFYELIDNYIEARTAFRELHFRHVIASQKRGEFIMGGALDTAEEAILIFKVSEKSIIEDFIRQDPYVKAGLVAGWRIRKWNVVIGGENFS